MRIHQHQDKSEKNMAYLRSLSDMRVRLAVVFILGAFTTLIAFPALAASGSDEAMNWGVMGMQLFGGLALFLFGMEQMADALKAVAGERMNTMLAKLPTIAAHSYKKSIGQPLIYPQNDLNYCENFLQMMFAVPCEPYEIDPDFSEALNLLLIVHADHEQNCSASTV